MLEMKKLSDIYTVMKGNNKEEEILTVYYRLVKMKEFVQVRGIDCKELHDERLTKTMELRFHQNNLDLDHLERTSLTYTRTPDNSRIYDKVS